MDTTRIIRGTINSMGCTVTSAITQWDYGWQFIPEIEDLPPTYRLDFSNEEKHGTALPVYCSTEGAEVPTELIDTGKDVWVWFVHIGEGYGITEYKWRIPNKCKPKTEQDEPTPSQQSSIDQAISVVNDAVETVEQKASEADQSAQSAHGYAEQAETARDNAVTAKTAAETAQGKAEDAQAAAESVAESIPSDYSQLSEDVSGLKEELSDMQTATASDVGKALKAKTVTDGKVTEWEFGEAGGGVDPEEIEQAVSDWLDEHPEATTTVADGSITKAKLAEALQYKVNNFYTYYAELDRWSIPNDGTDAATTTTNINSMFVWAKEHGFNAVALPAGTYLINGVRPGGSGTTNIGAGILIPSNMALMMTHETTLKVATNSSSKYACIYIGQGQENILIKGGRIIGDRATHEFGTGSHEYGHGVYVQGCENLIIDNVYFDGFTGDAIYYGNYGTATSDAYRPVKNSRIINCTIKNSRRNNISLTGVDNVVVANNYIYGAGTEDEHHDGTSPRTGIDVEGYGEGETDYSVTKRVIIVNNTFENNVGGSVMLATGYECVIDGNITDRNISYGAGNNIVISNNIFYRTDTNSGTAINGLRVSNGFNGNYVVISGNSINGFETGIGIRGDKNLAIGNRIANCTTGISLYNAGYSACINNVVDTYSTYGITVAYNISGCVVKGNILHNGHGTGINVANSGSSGATNIDIEDNSVLGISGTGASVDGTNIRFCRNKIRGTSSYGFTFTADANLIYVVQNEFQDTGSYAFKCTSGTATTNKVYVVENTFYFDNNAIYLTKTMSIDIIDNKFIATPLGANHDAVIVSGDLVEDTPKFRNFIGNIIYSTNSRSLRYAIKTEKGGSYLAGNKAYSGTFSTHTNDVLIDNYPAST